MYKKHRAFVLNRKVCAYLMKSAKYKIWHIKEKIKAKYLYLAK